MYKFIDTTEVSESVVLPSEALQINGEYIENLIDGYRTLGVSGREALSPELSYYETGVRDGSVLQSKRYPARIIIVSYQLIAESNEAFREAYNKLGKILNVENAELIFNDELDKYFVGTPSAIGEIEPGRNAVAGEIEILCTDPFKYSVVEYEATASLDESSILVDYNGTYKSYPKFEVEFYKETEVAEDGETANALTGNGDCGFVAFFNEDEKIIQVGDPNEVDGVNAYAKSQTLMNQLFTGQYAWGTKAKALWSLNNGIVFPEGTQQSGDVRMARLQYSSSKNSFYLAASDYGTAADAWHGVSITRQIAADSAGEVGASNFTFTYNQVMCTGRTGIEQYQMGAFQVQLADEDGAIVAGVRIHKNKVGKLASMLFYVNGAKVYGTMIDLSYKNQAFGAALRTTKTNTITKTGNKVIFNVGGVAFAIRDAMIAETKVTQVTFMFEQYSNKTPLSYNGLCWAKFVKNNCDTFKDIPNKFSANDVLEIDCKNAMIYLNNVKSEGLGALGNDWEEFCLTSGLNQIGFAYSEWITDEYAPTIKVKYREVFL